MKRFRLGVVAFLLTVSLLPAGASEKAEPWIQKMIGQMEAAHAYKYTAVVQMGQSMNINMSGEMAQADDTHYRGTFDMTMKKPSMPEGSTMKMVMVADGETAWVEGRDPMTGGTQVMKLDLSAMEEMAAVIPEIKNIHDMNPGRRIARMTEVFDVGLVGVADGKVTLSAEVTDDQISGFFGEMGSNAFSEVMIKKLTVVLDEKTGHPREVRMGEPAMFAMHFTDFELADKAAILKLCTYAPPEGANVMDLEKMMNAASSGK